MDLSHVDLSQLIISSFLDAHPLAMRSLPMNVLIGLIDRLHRYNQQQPQPPSLSLLGLKRSIKSFPQETKGVVVAPFKTAANALSMQYIPRTLITCLMGGSTSNIFNYPPTSFIISFINLTKYDLLQRPFILFCVLSRIRQLFMCNLWHYYNTDHHPLSVVSEIISRPFIMKNNTSLNHRP